MTAPQIAANLRPQATPKRGPNPNEKRELAKLLRVVHYSSGGPRCRGAHDHAIAECPTLSGLPPVRGQAIAPSGWPRWVKAVLAAADIVRALAARSERADVLGPIGRRR